MINKDSALTAYARKALLLYSVDFCEAEVIVENIKEVQKAGFTDDMKMTLARAYYKTGASEIGLKYLNEAKIAPDNILDSLTYWSVKSEIMENLGEYKSSLNAFRNYSKLLEEYHMRLFSNELLFSEKKHNMEIANKAKIQKRDDVIKWILVGVSIMLCLIGIIYYKYRLNKAGRLIAEGNAEKLYLEAKNLELKNENFKLETDNLHLQVLQLEEEKDRLEYLLKKQSMLSGEARQVVRERIEILNGLFAKALTNEEKYGKEFQEYVEKIRKDKKKFQESIGKVLEGTHPEFMTYLREHGLTEREIDYVCLYAIGLRGKEIGNYLELARHYNISSDVRRKLGLDTNGENLGPFIRRLMKGE